MPEDNKRPARAHDAAAPDPARFESLVNAIRDFALCRLDGDGTIISWNEGARIITGYDAREIIGQNFSTLFAAENELNGVPQSALEAAQVRGRCAVEASGVRKGGEKFQMEVVVTRISDADEAESGYALTVRDITERKLAEIARRDADEQLRHAQKMDAIARLAGGVAHDFNNLLTSINGYSELALRRLNEADPVHLHVSEIKRAAEGAASLTRQLLAFSRRQLLAPEVFNLNRMLAELDGMLRRLLGEGIELRVSLDESIGLVKADPTQIEQVVVNIASNARDAMAEGGRLTISTSSVYLDAETARRRPPMVAGHYVLLQFADTGCGMDAETRSRVFEPFFTTKQVGKGRGLGLSTVYGIVKQSGGYVWVSSELGRGATFDVFLPRVNEYETARREPRAMTAPTPSRGAETVLLVEDEDSVRDVMHDILEASGYRILAASNGEEALRIAKEHEGRINLLLTDVLMPGISGRELAKLLISSYPNMRVLYISGHADAEFLRYGVAPDDVQFIRKPFSADALTQKVRRTFQESSKF